VANIRDESTVFKLNLALKRLPVFKGFDAKAQGFAYPAAVRIGPGTDYIEKAFDASKYGDFSRRPVMTMVTASALDDSLAPPGKHVMSVMGQHAPYTLRGRTWADARDELYRTTLETIEEFAPGFADCIEHVQLLTPLDFRDDLRPAARARPPRRAERRPDLLPPPGAQVRRPPHAHPGPVPVRRLHPPRRRRHRRAGPQRGPGDPGRPRKPLNGCH
jgi:phytoene dehydrogenase-like protein